jgi:hypothetical protein
VWEIAKGQKGQKDERMKKLKKVGSPPIGAHRICTNNGNLSTRTAFGEARRNEYATPYLLQVRIKIVRISG